MFIFFPTEERFEHSQPEWVAAWNAALITARDLASRENETWMFHGTTLSSAQSIMRDGFKCPTGIIPPGDNHVYWGTLQNAINFADRGYDRPALLAARIEDILASGTPLPLTSEDRLCENDSELPDWQTSIAQHGALRICGGTRVAEMIILGENA